MWFYYKAHVLYTLCPVTSVVYSPGRSLVVAGRSFVPQEAGYPRINGILSVFSMTGPDLDWSGRDWSGRSWLMSSSGPLPRNPLFLHGKYTFQKQDEEGEGHGETSTADTGQSDQLKEITIRRDIRSITMIQKDITVKFKYRNDYESFMGMPRRLDLQNYILLKSFDRDFPDYSDSLWQ